jgi:hypothetical protein
MLFALLILERNSPKFHVLPFPTLVVGFFFAFPNQLLAGYNSPLAYE